MKVQSNNLYDFVIIFLDAVLSKAYDGLWIDKKLPVTHLNNIDRNIIAWDLLVAVTSKEGVRLGESYRREMGNKIKEVSKLGISEDEFREFTRILLTEVYQKPLACLQKQGEHCS